MTIQNGKRVLVAGFPDFDLERARTDEVLHADSAAHAISGGFVATASVEV